MDPNVERLINAGTTDVDKVSDALIELRQVPRQFYDQLRERRAQDHAFLRDLPFDDAFAFIRGLVLCESHRVFHPSGSTSPIIPAFAALQSREPAEWTEIADWVVMNHDNPWTPFDFQRTRDQWLAARRDSGSPLETWRRTLEFEEARQSMKAETARKQEMRETLEGLSKGRVPSSEDMRERLADAMERGKYE